MNQLINGILLLSAAGMGITAAFGEPRQLPRVTIDFDVSKPGCDFPAWVTLTLSSTGLIEAEFGSSQNSSFSGRAMTIQSSATPLCSDRFACETNEYMVCVAPAPGLIWGEVDSLADIMIHCLRVEGLE